ncbi:MAG: thermonuclease family protein [Desulfobacteraceae bacterium]|nr:thermonuclease family protein [Desulfobacteraceae bacterium]
MSESFYICLISGLVITVALYKFLRRNIRKDPLPEKDPACIWHSTVKKIHKVYDGDTIFAYVKGHNPIDNKPTGIRIRGIDTPEMRDSRPSVKKKAQKAKEFVESEINKARKIHLYNISMNDKYGRMLATVFCDRKDIAKMLLEKKLAKAYDGGKKAKW